MRTGIAAITASVTLLAASSALAQDEFATQGTVALSADRLFGLTLTTDTDEDDAGNKETTSATTFSLLGGGGASYYSIPRLGIDFFPIDGLSLGGSLIFLTRSTEFEDEPVGGPSVSDDGPTTTAFMLMPRVGYGVMFSDNVGLWPRGGITYYTVNTEIEVTNPVTNQTQTFESTDSGFAFTIEVPLVLSPVPNVALTVGPTFDIPLSGSRESDTIAGGSVETDHTIFEFGLHAGLLAWF